MLSQDEFAHWCRRLNFSDLAQNAIERIRSSGPSRNVGGGSRNFTGRYSSRKMGVTIQFESHKVELPIIYQLEHDEDVLEFFDQPPAIKLSYQSSDGRQLGFFYTPDLFVIRKDSAGWVECKTEDELKKLAEKNSNRYFKAEDGQWHSPPGEQYAEQFGFYFRICSNAEIDWVLQRNLIFLADYYRAESSTINESTTKAVFSVVSAQPGITLNQLLHHAQGASPDDIYFLIATEQRYIELGADPLVEPERCFVFRDRQTALAYSAAMRSQASSNTISPTSFELVPGTLVSWDGRSYSIVLFGETEITLRAEDGRLVDLKLTEFDRYVGLGKIAGLKTQLEDGCRAEIKKLLLQASQKDLEEANRRYKLIEPYLIR